MNLGDRDDRTVAAGEYVLGTLGGEERHEFERVLATDGALQAEVYAWQDRLLPLAGRVASGAPTADDWAAIEVRLERKSAANGVRAVPQAATHTSANDPLWQRLRRWQVTAAGAIAASLVLATVLLLRGPVLQSDRYLAVLQAPGDNSAGWVVEITAGERVRLRPVGVSAPLPPVARVAVLDQDTERHGPHVARLGNARPGHRTTGVALAGARGTAAVRVDTRARNGLADRPADRPDSVRRPHRAALAFANYFG